MNEEVAFLTVNTVTNASSCIGSHVGIDFLNHNFKQESQDNNFVGLFNKFVSGMVWFRFKVFNAIFINISVISLQSVLLLEEIGVPEENHCPVTSH